MRKKKNVFMRNQRKKFFKLKGFKQALSLVMILLMCLVLLPQIPTEAVGNTYTVYFDASNNPSDNGWSTNVQMYVYGFGDGETGIKAMKKSERGENLWEYTFDKKYPQVIFLPTSSWPGDKKKAGQTDNITVDWSLDSPCFKLDGGYVSGVGSKTGVWSDLGPNTRQGKPISFVDMTGNLLVNNIVAVFGTDTDFSNSKEVKVNDDGKFIVPNDTTDGSVYRYVKFKNGTNDITETYKVTSNVTDGTNINISLGISTLYYGVTESSNGTNYSYWSTENTSSGSINGKKLYLEKSLFSSKNETYIQIGDNPEEKLTADLSDEATLSYEISSNATQQTIITIRTSDGTKYHFFWSDLGQNLVTISNNVAVVSSTYSKTYTVYFDATLSKLSYVGTENAGDFGIPKANVTVIKYHAWIEGGTSKDGELTKVGSVKIGDNEWSDVYKADLDKQYEKILFYSGDITSKKCDKTIDLTIPTNLSSPCFYANSSDDAIYGEKNREGYWDEVYTVRDPEVSLDSNNANTGSKDSNKVVDISEKEFTKDKTAKYVSTTFYDYYTDYELNGNNRDNYYHYDNNINSVKNHRIYQPFRQFDQALSSYYEKNNASDPIYWGNFQNYSGSKFTEIADTLNLYGYGSGELYKKFFYQNNSMWGADGKEIKQGGENATLELVNNELDSNDNLLINTNSKTTIKAPYFDEDFLSGDNSKNTVLGKVYNNVDFPFKTEALSSKSVPSAKGTVDYWVYDSKTMPLNMKQTSTGKYYLETGDKVLGQTTTGSTTDGNFFPFNTKNQSGKASQLNYGFAMKLQLEFRLTKDGKVTTTEGEEVPIEFNFSGDDDVWIFIDGKLALDIGGGHDVVTGRLDFANEKYYISKVKKNDSGYEDNKTGDFKLVGDNSSTHTLTMFYMERGLWESNMYISYNFPDDNKLEVEKQVDTTEVDDLFKNYFEQDNKLFTFNIKNRVTHYGSKKVSETTTEPVTFNDTFEKDKIYPSVTDNTFEHKDSFEGQSNVAHWKAKFDDASGTYINKRLGVIQLANGSTIDISKTKKYLQFKYYINDSRAAALDQMYIEIEDANGKDISGWLSASKVYGTFFVKNKQWQKLSVDIAKLNAETGFDYTKVKYVKFGFKYERNIYLDDFKFASEDTVNVSVGFVTKQDTIPDYNSATTGELENATNALFEVTSKNTTTKSKSTYYRVNSEGNFALANNEKAIFSNQFRRGSYISLTEEVDSNVFSTKWTLYENDVPVSSYGTGTTVKNPNPIPSLIDKEGVAIDDGRTESVDKNSTAANYTGEKPNSNTIVFRPYSTPDDETSETKLKALFVNKVRTGSIIIEKGKAETSPELNGEYTFTITFTNIAGMSLEDAPIVKTITIRNGESYELSGIPAGTSYSIKETNASDNAKVESIEVSAGNDTNNVDLENMTVTGVVVADDGENPVKATYTFKNTTRKKISINLEKKWQDESGSEISAEDSSLPKSIYVQLQRKFKDETDDKYTTVQVDGKDYVEVVADYDGWNYTFNGLDKYEDTEETKEYVYRIVEVEIDNGIVTIPENNRITLNGKDYDISYTNPVSDENSQYTITNKLKKGSITIVKADSETKETITAFNSKFKIQKLKDTSKDKEVDAIVDSDFDTTSFTESAGSTKNGVLKFDNLPNGTYLITEVEAPSGYIKLDKPFKITIPYEYKQGDIVDGKVAVTGGEKADITLKVLNPKGAVLPRAGLKGISLYLAIGTILVMVSGAFILYKLNKDKKIN